MKTKDELLLSYFPKIQSSHNSVQFAIPTTSTCNIFHQLSFSHGVVATDYPIVPISPKEMLVCAAQPRPHEFRSADRKTNP